MPSAATRLDALAALLPSFTRRISSARSMLPAASASAFLHSIIGASVFSRNSFTMFAVTSAIVGFPVKRSLAFFARVLADLDEFVVGHAGNDTLGRIGLAFQDRIGDT